RAHDQKSFRITARGKYGTSSVDFPLIPEKSFISSYKNFNLRNGGSEYHYTRFRDAFMQKIMKDENVDRMGYEPAIVFLNGEYWGEYEIREKQDEHYLQSNYGIPKDQVDLLSHKGYIRALAGTVDAFFAMHKFVTTADPQEQTYYKEVEQVLDLENFADYFIAQTYYSNEDWIDHSYNSNNIKFWKPHKPNGRWRYIFWDLDQASGLYGKSPAINNLPMVINPNEPNEHSAILNSLLKNERFKYYFINRYADLMNTVFQFNNIREIAYDMRDSISSSMIRHKERWGGTYEKWLMDVDKLVEWHFQRLDLQRGFVQDQFNLPAQVNVTLEASPPNSGRIKISTIIPDSLPWKGVYYNGVPVTISAIPNPGFTFDYWGVNKNISFPDYNDSITLNISSDDNFIAYFTGSAINPKLTFSEINYHSDSLRDAGDWFELHNYDDIAINLTGWIIKDGKNSNAFEIPPGTVISPNGYLVFSCDTQKFSSQFPFLTDFIGELPFNLKNSGDNLRLYKYDKSLYLSATYSNNPSWPTEADGKGKTLELKDPQVSLDLGTNWFAGCIGGSPGVAYNRECLTNVDEFVDGSFRLVVGPNPSIDIITINIIINSGSLSDLHFIMYDFAGNEVKKNQNLRTNEIVINRSNYSPGIYIIKIGNSEHFITEKIIFQ
ncbi:MAG: CotH kinase family protein, partial [Bacteroidota bacterium]|nr:CotH kinase family protein [Bacteroidota bacterium]